MDGGVVEGDDEPQIDLRAEAARKLGEWARERRDQGVRRFLGIDPPEYEFRVDQPSEPAAEFNKDLFEQKIRALKRDRYLNISADCEPICFNGDSVTKFNTIARKANALLGKDNDLSLNLSDLEPLLDELAERRKVAAKDHGINLRDLPEAATISQVGTLIVDPKSYASKGACRHHSKIVIHDPNGGRG